MKFNNLNISVIVLLVAFAVACNSNGKPEKQENTVYVKTKKVIRKSFALRIHASGNLASKSELKLSFKTGGIINTINVDEGQEIKKGTTLAELKFDEIYAWLKQANLGLQKAKRDFSRVENLYKDSVATLEQYQDMQTALEFAESNVKIARFNSEHSKIVAQSDGKILKKLAEENEMIAPGYPVFLFGTYENDWIVRINVVDKDLVLIELDDDAIISFDAFPNRTFKGTVSEIGSMADPYTGTYEIEIRVKDADEKFASGFIAKIDIVSKKSNQFILVPINAIIEGSESNAYIYELVENKPVKIKVAVDHFDDKYLYVTEGTNAGSVVITDGSKYITKNCIVEIKNN